METKNISQTILARLPGYLDYLLTLPEDDSQYISSGKIAEEFAMGEVQVRKDLAAVSTGGKPKVGYLRVELIKTLEEILRYKDIENVVIVGAGKLGSALINYNGFERYGLNISMAFDVDKEVIEKNILNKPVLPLKDFTQTCKNNNIKIGIIATPAKDAQSICDLMVESGILAIMNFTATTQLKVPKYISLQNVNIASMLALLKVNL
ncbi:MAG: redox-sensing transcriptional repressor Rex [Lachnospirales bacterium]